MIPTNPFSLNLMQQSPMGFSSQNMNTPIGFSGGLPAPIEPVGFSGGTSMPTEPIGFSGGLPMPANTITGGLIGTQATNVPNIPQMKISPEIARQMLQQMFMRNKASMQQMMPNVRTAADIFQAPRPIPPRPDVMPIITPSAPSRVVDYDRRVPPPRPSRIM